MKLADQQPLVIPPGGGTVLNFLGVTHKLTRLQTGGAIYLFEAEFEPASGNRLHVHRYEDEIVRVLSGEIQIRLGNGNLRTGAGGVAHLPKNIPHALYNPLQTPLKILVITVPGGMEAFFDELEAAQAAGRLDKATHAEISRRYGINWLE